jgi:ubiquinone biosynthesis protein
MVITVNDDILEAIRTVLGSVPLLPARFARYQPLLVETLVSFFGRLPPEHLGDIIAAQAMLGPAADPDTRLVALLQQCPTLHKLGQVVAHEHSLGETLRERLQSLESLPPATDPALLRAFITAELGDRQGIEIAPQALAEGSVAVIVPFVWTDPGGGKLEGVFKLLKPRAVERMQQELAIWNDLSDTFDERARAYDLPELDYRAIIDSVARLLLGEVELEREQGNLAWAAAFYSDSKEVVIPRLLPFCTPRLTAMERIHGTKVTDTALGEKARKKLARTLVRALVADPFWKATELPARFHADPHAGNLFFTADGRLAILDWALTTELTGAQLSGVVRALLGGLTLDEAEIHDAIASLGEIHDEDYARAEIAAAITLVRRGTFPGFVWLVTLLDRLGRLGHASFPEATTLFRKSLLTLSGVVTDVFQEASMDRVLLASGAAQFRRELRRRPAAAPGSRKFGTHVSNTDLVKLWVSVPWTPARYLLDTWRDLLLPPPAASPAPLEPPLAPPLVPPLPPSTKA